MGVTRSPRGRRRQSLAAALTKENLFQASGKDFVRRIYRSARALKNERVRQRRFKHFVIHPFSNFRSVPPVSLLPLSLFSACLFSSFNSL